MHQFLKIYFWNKTPHVSDGSSVHHHEFSTVHTAIRPDPDRKLSANLYDVYHCCVYSKKNSWWWTEEPFETCRILF